MVFGLFWKSAANLSGMVAICYNDFLRCFFCRKQRLGERDGDYIFWRKFGTCFASCLTTTTAN
jgi:hypothetical protein